jgi:hypothetical protein
VRENRMLGLTWRGLETWQGGNLVTLATERASNREHKPPPKPARQSSTLLLERAQETWAKAELGTRSTIERVVIGNSPPKAARACALLGALGPDRIESSKP